MKALLIGVTAVLTVSVLAVLYFAFRTLVSANAKEAARLAEREKKSRETQKEKVQGAGV